MQKKSIYLIASTLILMGCTKSQADIKPAISPQVTSKVQIQTPKKTGINLADLKQAKALNNLSLKAKKSYALNESIQFIINTGDNEGYLYLIYLDDKGKTGLLYPNKNSPLSEMGGEFLFPQDFGNMNIRATKDCKGCTEEKTTIYAILSKEPILDINNISKNNLLDMTSTSKDRGMVLELGNNTKSNSNLNVGKIDFLVK